MIWCGRNLMDHSLVFIYQADDHLTAVTQVKIMGESLCKANFFTVLPPESLKLPPAQFGTQLECDRHKFQKK